MSEKEIKKLEPTKILTEAELEDIKLKFERARSLLLVEKSFYGLILLELEGIISSNDVEAKKFGFPCVAVNYKNIFIQGVSPDWVDPNDPEAVKAKQEAEAQNGPSLPLFGEVEKTYVRMLLLIHETLHVVLGHLGIPKEFNHKLANIAQDAIIHRIMLTDPSLRCNLLFEQFKNIVTPVNTNNVNSKDFNGIKLGPQTFQIDGFMQKDWIAVYRALEKEGQSQGGKNGQTLEQWIDGLDFDNLGAVPDEGEINSQDQLDAKFDIEVKMQEILENHSKSQGHLPSEIEDRINSLKEAKIPWTREFRRLIQDVIASNDFSLMSNSRKAHLAPALPKLFSKEIGSIWCVVDTSGSMSMNEIEQGISEFKSMRQTHKFDLYYCTCDAKVHDVIIFDRHKRINWEKEAPIRGRGGTDFKPVFKKVEEMIKEGHPKPAGMVFFTDTYGDFPSEPPKYPVIWVTAHKGVSVPWGKLLYAGD